MNNLLTIDMITKDAIELFKNSNIFIKSFNEEFATNYNKTVIYEPSIKEVIMFGAAAILVKNPIVTRRFWNIFK